MGCGAATALLDPPVLHPAIDLSITQFVTGGRSDGASMCELGEDVPPPADASPVRSGPMKVRMEGGPIGPASPDARLRQLHCSPQRPVLLRQGDRAASRRAHSLSRLDRHWLGDPRLRRLPLHRSRVGAAATRLRARRWRRTGPRRTPGISAEHRRWPTQIGSDRYGSSAGSARDVTPPSSRIRLR